jgi:isopenicillin N synthase-like dioxygenase
MTFTPPILDVQRYPKSIQDKAQFLRDFRDALTHPGFMLLVGTGFEEGEKRDHVLRVRQYMAEFFGTWSTERKEGLIRPGTNGEVGYTGFQKDRLHDLSEQLQLGPGVAPYHLNALPAIPGFTRSTMQMFRDLGELATMMYGVVAEAFGKPDYFKMFEGETRSDLLRLACYPGLTAQQATEAQPGGRYEGSPQLYRASPHDDSCLLTLLLIDYMSKGLQVDISGSAGLGNAEVREEDREYVNVNIQQQGIILNTGRVLEWLTDGVKRPAFHRVIVPGDPEFYETARYTMPYFAGTPMKIMVDEPLCWHPTENGKVFTGPDYPHQTHMRHVASWRPNAE